MRPPAADGAGGNRARDVLYDARAYAGSPPPGATTLPDPDSLRTARLLLSKERAEGTATEDHVRRLARLRREPRPARPRVLAGPFHRVAMKAGRLGYTRTLVPRDHAARQAVLGARADGPPRLLIRVDEFPHARASDHPERFGTERFARFHEIMAEAGVPYLVALMPRVSGGYLDPTRTDERALDRGEIEMIERLPTEGVTFGLHGRNHRTRDADPRRHSELSGLTAAALQALLDDAEGELERTAAARPRVFVAPFNRFDAAQYDILARRYDVITGGPETVRILGLRPTPEWRGDAVYLPSYPPLYGRAREIAAGAETLERLAPGLWAPAVIHWGQECDDWDSFRRAVRTLARLARPWHEFLDAVRDSR